MILVDITFPYLWFLGVPLAICHIDANPEIPENIEDIQILVICLNLGRLIGSAQSHHRNRQHAN